MNDKIPVNRPPEFLINMAKLELLGSLKNIENSPNLDVKSAFFLGLITAAQISHNLYDYTKKLPPIHDINPELIKGNSNGMLRVSTLLTYLVEEYLNAVEKINNSPTDL